MVQGDVRAVYLIKLHKTKMIWTSHPYRFRHLGTDLQKMYQYLSDTFRS